LSPQAIAALEKTSQYSSIGHYSPRFAIISNLRFLFVYYSEAEPKDFTDEMMKQYLPYLAKTLGCSRTEIFLRLLDGFDLTGKKFWKRAQAREA
jgi:hypothetical protein